MKLDAVTASRIDLSAATLLPQPPRNQADQATACAAVFVQSILVDPLDASCKKRDSRLRIRILVLEARND
jgi:hypothetical protein